ncbi:MAG: VWA domain-containing protein, partial [Acidimicrobiia bacterium]
MRRVLVAFLVVVMTVGPSAWAPAQTSSGSVLLIMDASGSMNRLDGAGVPLIDGAKDALREIVHRLPPDANVGLRVYGHRTSNQDPVAGCVDTELVVPVGPIDRGALNAAIDSFEASGFTPIGLSLQEAAEDLAAAGSGTIILVSDGVDTCAPPDPCEVAEQLAVEGFATQIHTVGFFLNDQAAVNQLQCIADAGHGTFTSVDSIDQFFEQLSGLVTEALEGPGRISPRIEGALTQELAPLLPWSRYNEEWPALENDAEGTIAIGETRWYAFDAGDDRVPNGHLYISAHIDWQPAAGPDEYLEVRVFDEGG